MCWEFSPNFKHIANAHLRTGKAGITASFLAVTPFFSHFPLLFIQALNEAFHCSWTTIPPWLSYCYRRADCCVREELSFQKSIGISNTMSLQFIHHLLTARADRGQNRNVLHGKDELNISQLVGLRSCLLSKEKGHMQRNWWAAHQYSFLSHLTALVLNVIETS